ncbi:unnamed protein product, partial [Prorocentrum cordatum]
LFVCPGAPSRVPEPMLSFLSLCCQPPARWKQRRPEFCLTEGAREVSGILLLPAEGRATYREHSLLAWEGSMSARRQLRVQCLHMCRCGRIALLCSRHHGPRGTNSCRTPRASSSRRAARREVPRAAEVLRHARWPSALELGIDRPAVLPVGARDLLRGALGILSQVLFLGISTRESPPPLSAGLSGTASCRVGAAGPAGRRIVELAGLAKAPELNGRRGVLTGLPDAGGRWEVALFAQAEQKTRRLSVTQDRLATPPGAAPAGSVRLRLRNVPAEYDAALLKEELEDECFMEGEHFVGLLFDEVRRFGYLTAACERVALQLIGQFDGRRLERAGPGRATTESALAQIVKVERLP